MTVKHNILSGSWVHDEFEDFVKNKMSEDEYKKALEGEYDLPDDWNLRGILGNSKYNTPEVNSKLDLNKVRQNQHFDKIGNQFDINLSNKQISDLLNGSDEDQKVGAQLYNEKTNKSPILTELFKRNKQDDKFLVSLNNLPDEHIQDYARDVLKIAQKGKKIDEAPVAKVLTALPQEETYQLVSQGNNYQKYYRYLSDDLKNRFNDEKLGITGGEHNAEIDDPEENFDNWSTGKGFDRRAAEWIAKNGKLSNSQAEHIMRHGSLEARFDMFHDQDINPDIKLQMYNKWYNDDSNHEYDQDHYKEHHYKSRRDKGDDDFWSEARDRAEADYPLDDFLRDQNHDEWDDAFETGGREAARQAVIDSDFDGDEERAYDSHSESLSDSEYNHYSDLLYERYNQNALDHEDNIPPDLLNHPGFQPHLDRINEEQNRALEAKKRAEDEEANKLNDSRIPNRESSHEYAPGQRQAEMLKDVADASGGSVDIGTMHKLYPNQKETWKGIFGNRGKMTSDEIQAHIDNMPKQKWDISYGKWDSNMQNLNGQDQTVFRLDHSDDSMSKIEAAGLKPIFNKISNLSRSSGHPTNPKTIGWARVDTTDPKHWIIDETQTDYSKAVRKFLKQNDKDEESNGVDKLVEFQKPWHEALINHIVKTAKQHGVEQISTHTPESKAAHTGTDNTHSVYKEAYGVMPNYGFHKVDAKNLDVLNQTGKLNIGIIKREPNEWDLKRRGDDHFNTAKKHMHNAKVQEDLAEQHKDELGLVNKLQLYAAGKASLSMAEQHKAAGLKIAPDHEDKDLVVQPVYDPDHEMNHIIHTSQYDKMLKPEKIKEQKMQTMDLKNPMSHMSLKKSLYNIMQEVTTTRWEVYNDHLRKAESPFPYKDPSTDAMDSAKNDDWVSAIKTAKRVKHLPQHSNIFSRLAALHNTPVPPEHFSNFLDAANGRETDSNAMFELSKNLHPGLSHGHLLDLAQRTQDDHLVHRSIKNHRSWDPHSEPSFASKFAPFAFWNSYERKVTPEHFALMAEHMNVPHYKSTHRGEPVKNIKNVNLFWTNKSNEAQAWTDNKFSKPYINLDHAQIHPDQIKAGLNSHAKFHQDKLIEDYYKGNPHNLEMKTFKGKQYVKLYRGVAGEYGQKLADKLGYDKATHSIPNKNIDVPSAPFSSWTQDKHMATRFAAGRGGSIGGLPVVIEKWHPIEDIAHTGFYSQHIEMSPAHPNESEVVIKHPDLKSKIKSTDLHIGLPSDDMTGITVSKPKVVRKKT